MVVVEDVLEAEGAADRDLPVLGEALEVAGRVGRPAAAADDGERALRTDQQLPELLHRLRIRMRVGRHDERQRRRRGGRGEHVLRQGQHHRSRAALHRGAEGARHVLRQAVGRLHLAHPLGQAQRAGAEHLPVVDLLERLAIALVGGHLAHQQDQGRRVLERDVHADAGVGGARPARDEAHAGSARELAVRLGHERRPALVAAGHEADALAVLVEAVERRQEALARHAEHRVDALGDQRLHQGVAGEACGNRGRGLGHGGHRWHSWGRRDGSRPPRAPWVRPLPHRGTAPRMKNALKTRKSHP